MQVHTYNNTISTLPNWQRPLHLDFPRGFAYETQNYFVHIYATENGFFLPQIGLTVIEEKQPRVTLQTWITRAFGAQNINQLNLNAGNSINGVWRPSLYDFETTKQALNFTETEMRSSEQALRLLVEKLDDLFLYIEPDNANSLLTYSHKTRELLILACTEVENSWTIFMNKAGVQPAGRNYNTTDYYRLATPLNLKEFQFTLKTYPAIPPITPYINWNTPNTTASLPWYDAYNKTKHDRSTNFKEASLINCINAVVAALILHCVRFSPFSMFENNNTFASLINQHFSCCLINPTFSSYYIPTIDLSNVNRQDIFIFDATSLAQPYAINPLTI